jgi:hypothetical protein
MNAVLIVQYLGFEAKTLVREYTFSVREPSTEPREFTVTIANEAFHSHRARYQDGPDICSHKLQSELAASSNHPPKSHFRITDAELDAYHSTHSPKLSRSPYAPRVAHDA